MDRKTLLDHAANLEKSAVSLFDNIQAGFRSLGHDVQRFRDAVNLVHDVEQKPPVDLTSLHAVLTRAEQILATPPPPPAPAPPPPPTSTWENRLEQLLDPVAAVQAADGVTGAATAEAEPQLPGPAWPPPLDGEFPTPAAFAALGFYPETYAHQLAEWEARKAAASAPVESSTPAEETPATGTTAENGPSESATGASPETR